MNEKQRGRKRGRQHSVDGMNQERKRDFHREESRSDPIRRTSRSSRHSRSSYRDNNSCGTLEDLHRESRRDRRSRNENDHRKEDHCEKYPDSRRNTHRGQRHQRDDNRNRQEPLESGNSHQRVASDGGAPHALAQEGAMLLRKEQERRRREVTKDVDLTRRDRRRSRIIDDRRKEDHCENYPDSRRNANRDQRDQRDNKCNRQQPLESRDSHQHVATDAPHVLTQEGAMLLRKEQERRRPEVTKDVDLTRRGRRRSRIIDDRRKEDHCEKYPDSRRNAHREQRDQRDNKCNRQQPLESGDSQQRVATDGGAPHVLAQEGAMLLRKEQERRRREVTKDVDLTRRDRRRSRITDDHRKEDHCEKYPDSRCNAHREQRDQRDDKCDSQQPLESEDSQQRVATDGGAPHALAQEGAMLLRKEQERRRREVTKDVDFTTYDRRHRKIDDGYLKENHCEKYPDSHHNAHGEQRDQRDDKCNSQQPLESEDSQQRVATDGGAPHALAQEGAMLLRKEQEKRRGEITKDVDFTTYDRRHRKIDDGFLKKSL
ncbi:hypothetical protein KIN20_003781 [Parelaphostrongylus tenuis]|uniref:Uncharacterized protein n=1 Tax=Parelaphostrongylus tenuis TaxID=148309 RepID=A0AAD5MQE9_PARTN|nr:hypothetical protein KIN20_003781 [Parelaphostrongylus tenuis]